MNYKVSCHCGNVAFEVEGKIDGALSCNCSICQRKGSLLWFKPYEDLNFLTPPNYARSYTFNRHMIKHCFCPDCGMHTHGEGVDQKGNKTAAINIRCIEGIELEGIPVQHWDGRSH
ncbi:GFA family protein [Massilia sp. SM-13]|uniref:GFA family protein n=1 Tax=Pseudoduganella rhizocola TaxID=3382643 RepID=UPI0038B54553